MEPTSAAAPEWGGDEKSRGQQPPPAYQANPGYPQAAYPQQGYGSAPQYGQPVTVQPVTYVTRVPLANPANDYLGYSIFTMLCCCLPLGIAALIYSISTRDANHAGDQVAAERSSRMARILNHTALGIGVGVTILCIIYVSVVASSVH